MIKCDGRQNFVVKDGLAKYGDILLCVDCLHLGKSATSLLMLVKEKEKRLASEEKYERNYIVVEELVVQGEKKFYVGAYFANHKIAWVCDTNQRTRNEGQKYAEFMMNEFSMGGALNPIAIVHLDEQRFVMLKAPESCEWYSTDKKVTDFL